MSITAPLVAPSDRAPRILALLQAPVLAMLLRLVIVVGGGWLALRLTGSLTPVLLALGAGPLVMGAVNAAAVAGGTWFKEKAA